MAGVYIHVPFCRQRYSYCDFYFVTSHRRVEEYVDAVCTEIRLQAESINNPEAIRTIYFGGGTPSRLGIDQLARILAALSEHFEIGAASEITIEVNPEDPTFEYLTMLREKGFTRLSIGLQSLRDDDLAFMRRVHSASEAMAFVKTAASVDFKSLSLDLIFGLPGMSSTVWKQNLEYAASSGAHHLSLYGLTIEPRTLLGKWVRTGKVIPAPDSRMERQFRMADEIMTSSGFDHYEISNFAKPGHRSQHNQAYWDHSNYVGFGPGAHSFWRGEKAVRWENVRNLNRYIASLNAGTLPVSDLEAMDADRLMREYVLLSLRTDGGLDLDRLRASYGHRLSASGRQLVSELEDAGKVESRQERIILTLSGRLVADRITSAFFDPGMLVQSV